MEDFNEWFPEPTPRMSLDQALSNVLSAAKDASDLFADKPHMGRAVQDFNLMITTACSTLIALSSFGYVPTAFNFPPNPVPSSLSGCADYLNMPEIPLEADVVDLAVAHPNLMKEDDVDVSHVSHDKAIKIEEPEADTADYGEAALRKVKRRRGSKFAAPPKIPGTYSKSELVPAKLKKRDFRQPATNKIEVTSLTRHRNPKKNKAHDRADFLREIFKSSEWADILKWASSNIVQNIVYKFTFRDRNSQLDGNYMKLNESVGNAVCYRRITRGATFYSFDTMSIYLPKNSNVWCIADVLKPDVVLMECTSQDVKLAMPLTGWHVPEGQTPMDPPKVEIYIDKKSRGDTINLHCGYAENVINNDVASAVYNGVDIDTESRYQEGIGEHIARVVHHSGPGNRNCWKLEVTVDCESQIGTASPAEQILQNMFDQLITSKDISDNDVIKFFVAVHKFTAHQKPTHYPSLGILQFKKRNEVEMSVDWVWREKLNLSSDCDELAKVVNDAGSIECLTCFKNCVVDVESLNKFENLIFLNLTANRLKELPKEIWSLKKLKTLLAGDNWITILPEDVGNLKELQHLDLRHCFLTSLPNSICSLSKLVHLDVSENSLCTLPQDIGNLQQLKILDLHYNPNLELPPSLWTLENLCELNLRYNSLKYLPSQVSGLKKLRYLNLRNNSLRELPQSIGSLNAKFSISLNPLKSIPDELLKHRERICDRHALPSAAGADDPR